LVRQLALRSRQAAETMANRWISRRLAQIVREGSTSQVAGREATHPRAIQPQQCSFIVERATGIPWRAKAFSIL
jgi:hypothetical protein